ncbi:hypothetical protein XCCB100_4053 [Xanthomonas campestris pv. campestris]|uniref:Uncharacterized protein n=1 Tax=Xanthomonas campestris pv. campestris (strain B100) TaxID=509169 RepID=B0RXN4_XANCB|nr:hypothetical protein XCCB100_4053 [Xanthomonas campestris pv. campestris]
MIQRILTAMQYQDAGKTEPPFKNRGVSNTTDHQHLPEIRDGNAQ